MKTFIISDTHFNHANIATYCQRPENFTELIEKRWNERVQKDDVVIHLGDVGIGKLGEIKTHIDRLNGTKILIRGNHDRSKSNAWWMKNGFAFSCDQMIFGRLLLTHEPYRGAKLPRKCEFNVHGHLHNIWHGFHANASVDPAEENEMKKFRRLRYDHQRLFAIEYTDYYPVEVEKFLAKPDKFYARGIMPNADAVREVLLNQVIT